jgi:hypothetical protein
MQRYDMGVSHGEVWAEPSAEGYWVSADEAEASIAAAVAAERERCAKVCERVGAYNAWQEMAEDCARAIRAQ